MRLAPIFLTAFAAVLAEVPAQNVWAPGSGADLTALFAQAAPGDIVILNGLYEPFLLNKGLVLIGPASIYHNFGMSSPTWDSRITVPAGQRARLVGVGFWQSSSLPGGVRPQQVTVSGEVSFEDCTFHSGYSESLVVAGGTVVMQRCTIDGQTGYGGYFRMQQGICTMSSCVLTGKHAAPGPFGSNLPSESAILIQGGTLVASGITATGGNGLGLPPSPAITCTGGALILTDSTLNGGSGFTSLPPGPGAPALAATASTNVARSNLVGGPGSPPGPAFAGNVQNVPQLVGLRMDHGLQFGLTSIATATVGTSQLLAIVGGFSATASTLSPVIEPVFGQPGQVFTLMLALPVAGTPLVAPVAVPNLQGLLGVEVWLQAFQLDLPNVRGSALVGGVLR